MIRRFGLFWFDFIVGDDLWTPVAVVAGLAATAVLVAVGVPAWWLLPLVAAGFLVLSIARAARAAAPPVRPSNDAGTHTGLAPEPRAP